MANKLFAIICNNTILNNVLIVFVLLVILSVVAVNKYDGNCRFEEECFNLKVGLQKKAHTTARLIWSNLMTISLISSQHHLVDTAFFYKKTLMYLDTIKSYSMLVLVKIRFCLSRAQLPQETEKPALFAARFISPTAVRLLTGVVYGDDTALSPQLRHHFKNIGMSHVMAASGFNISLILTVAQTLIGRFLPRRAWLIFSCLVIWWYGQLLSWPASLIRAATMAVWLLLAKYAVGRPVSGLVALALTFVTTALLWPELLLAIGWQLSFAATAGLVVFSHCTSNSVATWMVDPLSSNHNHQLKRMPIVTILFEGIVTGLVVQFATLPIIWREFGEVSWVGIPANATLVWFTPLMTTWAVYNELLGFIVANWESSLSDSIISIVSLPLGYLVDIFVTGVVWWSNLVAEPFWQLPGKMNWTASFIWWFCFIFVFWWWRRMKEQHAKS